MLSVAEQSLVDYVVYKISIRFCRNPNEVVLTPQSMLKIANLSFNILKNVYALSIDIRGGKDYRYQSSKYELCKQILNKTMSSFPEHVHEKDQIDYFVNNLLYSYCELLEYPLL